jgi:predicted dehydrogenase
MAVSDVDPARARAAAASAGDGARALADPHELIADPGVDAVVVASV